MAMRLPLLLLLLVAAGGAVLLATRCDLGWADANALTKTSEVFVEGPLVAHAAESAAEASAPSLQGRGIGRPAVPATTGVDVRVVARAGRPVPERQVIARWTVPDTGAEHAVRGRTDDEGRALLLDVPQDGSARVSVWGHGDAPPLADDDPRVTGPDLEIRIEELLEASLVCVDAESGCEIDDVSVVWFDGVTHGDLTWVQRGALSSCVPLVAPPPGYLAWEETDWTLGIGQWTREVTAIYPLRREVAVDVSVLDHLGRPEAAADVEHFTVAGRPVFGQRVESSGVGGFRLRGVPFLRGEPLVVEVCAPYLRYPIAQQVALPSHPSDRTDLEFVLPAPGSQEKRDPTIHGCGGGSSSRFCLGRGTFEKGSLEVRVLRHDGSPASGAIVYVGYRKFRLDAEGVLRKEQFSTGRWTVNTRTIGLLPVSGIVEVRAGKMAQLVLREPRGGAIDACVVDADGRPATFAELYLELPSEGSWVDERDGVQRVDPFTDHLGRRRLARVETGTVKIRARWASRRGTAEVAVRENEPARVTIVVR